MLVIRRHPGQAIVVGDEVEIEVMKCGPHGVVLGIRAPREVAIGRREAQSTRQQNLAAALRVPAVTGEGMRQFPLVQVSASGGDKDT